MRWPDACICGVDLPDPELAGHWDAGAFEPLFGDIGRLPFPEDAFDLVLAIEVLEHVPFPELALAELHRVARRDLVVSVPRERVWSLANLARGKYLTDLGNTPGHINHWSKKVLRRAGGATLRRARRSAARSPGPWWRHRCDPEAPPRPGGPWVRRSTTTDHLPHLAPTAPPALGPAVEQARQLLRPAPVAVAGRADRHRPAVRRQRLVPDLVDPALPLHRRTGPRRLRAGPAIRATSPPSTPRSTRPTAAPPCGPASPSNPRRRRDVWVANNPPLALCHRRRPRRHQSRLGASPGDRLIGLRLFNAACMTACGRLRGPAGAGPGRRRRAGGAGGRRRLLPRSRTSGFIGGRRLHRRRRPALTSVALLDALGSVCRSGPSRRQMRGPGGVVRPRRIGASHDRGTGRRSSPCMGLLVVAWRWVLARRAPPGLPSSPRDWRTSSSRSASSPLWSAVVLGAPALVLSRLVVPPQHPPLRRRHGFAALVRQVPPPADRRSRPSTSSDHPVGLPRDAAHHLHPAHGGQHAQRPDLVVALC